MAQTVIVKGRVFSVDDTLANEIEHNCSWNGSEIKLDASGKVKAQQAEREDEEAPTPRRSRA